jgi:hypothetical protein
MSPRLDLPGQLDLPDTGERPADLAKRQAASPLRPQAPQEPCDHGLFSDQGNQLTLPIDPGNTA